MKEQEIRLHLASKLREFRQQAGLTATEVGAIIGKSAKTVSGWEYGRGQPDADMLLRLCELYHVSSIAEFYTDAPMADLTAPEAELLNIYRSLNDGGRQLLMDAARAYHGNPSLKKGSSSSVTA